LWSIARRSAHLSRRKAFTALDFALAPILLSLLAAK
jgi:hypothetical protein